MSAHCRTVGQHSVSASITAALQTPSQHQCRQSWRYVCLCWSFFVCVFLSLCVPVCVRVTLSSLGANFYSEGCCVFCSVSPCRLPVFNFVILFVSDMPMWIFTIQWNRNLLYIGYWRKNCRTCWQLSWVDCCLHSLSQLTLFFASVQLLVVELFWDVIISDKLTTDVFALCKKLPSLVVCCHRMSNE